MNKNILLLLFLASMTAFADDSKKDTQVRYRSGKAIDFESLLIEGQNRRPEVSVVTGNIGDQDNGLIKLREDFIDQMADDAGESVE